MDCKRREIWGFNHRQEGCRTCREQFECERGTLKRLHGVAADFNHCLDSNISSTINDAKRLREEINSAWNEWYNDPKLKPADALRTFNDLQASSQKHIKTFYDFTLKDPTTVGDDEGLLCWLLFHFRNDSTVLEEVETASDDTWAHIDAISEADSREFNKARRAYESYCKKVRDEKEARLKRKKKPGTKHGFPPLWFNRDDDIKKRLGNPNDKVFQNFIRIYQHLWGIEQQFDFKESYALMMKHHIPYVDHTPIFLKPIDYDRIARLLGMAEGTTSLRYYIQEMVAGGILRSSGKKFHKHGQRLLSIGYYSLYGTGKYNKIKWLADGPQMRKALREFEPFRRQRNHSKGASL